MILTEIEKQPFFKRFYESISILSVIFYIIALYGLTIIILKEKAPIWSTKGIILPIFLLFVLIVFIRGFYCLYKECINYIFKIELDDDYIVITYIVYDDEILSKKIPLEKINIEMVSCHYEAVITFQERDNIIFKQYMCGEWGLYTGLELKKKVYKLVDRPVYDL